MMLITAGVIASHAMSHGPLLKSDLLTTVINPQDVAHLDVQAFIRNELLSDNRPSTKLSDLCNHRFGPGFVEDQRQRHFSMCTSEVTPQGQASITSVSGTTLAKLREKERLRKLKLAAKSKLRMGKGSQLAAQQTTPDSAAAAHLTRSLKVSKVKASHPNSLHSPKQIPPESILPADHPSNILAHEHAHNNSSDSLNGNGTSKFPPNLHSSGEQQQFSILETDTVDSHGPSDADTTDFMQAGSMQTDSMRHVTSVDCFAQPNTGGTPAVKDTQTFCVGRNILLDSCAFYDGENSGFDVRFAAPKAGALRLACRINLAALSNQTLMKGAKNKLWWRDAASVSA